jgi:hypothetical protein
MWLSSEDLLLEGLSFELGSLYYYDDRGWWWDADLDAVRLEWGTDTFSVEVSVASELVARDSTLGTVDPAHEDVLRFMGGASWEYLHDQTIELFALHQDDSSTSEVPGQIVDTEDEDSADGNLTWLGARLKGGRAMEDLGILGYWLDSAYVLGKQTDVEFDELGGGLSEVDDTFRRSIRGWAIDAGMTWITPLPLEPRFTVGYAIGSGDRDPDVGTDHTFYPTGLQSNYTSFGGARTFPIYGAYLYPDLSNLAILTLGSGVSILSSSSLDVVYHRYRQVEPNDFIRGSNLYESLSGTSRDIGHGADAVLALRELTWLEFDLVLSSFYTGRAFEPDDGKWNFGVIAGVTVNF